MRALQFALGNRVCIICECNVVLNRYRTSHVEVRSMNNDMYVYQTCSYACVIMLRTYIHAS